MKKKQRDQKSGKPNILWIMVDQLRADCLGFMGNNIVQTPHLDKLASEGIVFTNAFCQSPVCMASRASLFTGRYPSTIKVRGMGILPPSETTFAEFLRYHGYYTACSGKLHFTPEQYTRNQLGSNIPIIDWRMFAKDACLNPVAYNPSKLNYGFQEYIGCEDILMGNFYSWLEKNFPELKNKKPEPLTDEGPRDLYISPYPSQAHPTTFIAKQAENFIRRFKDKNPWFVLCSFIAPHHPFEAPQEQIDRYDFESIPLPLYKGGVEKRFIPEPASGAIDEIKRYPEFIQRKIAQHYFASISLIDDCVEDLVKTLEETGQIRNTIIIFTSDHGEFLGNHGLLRKPSIHYDEVIRVPLLIKLPDGSCSGKRIDRLFELVDIYPTLAGFLGLPLNPGVQGIDRSKDLIKGKSFSRESIYSDMFDIRPVFGSLSGPYMAVMTLRTEEWKLNIYPSAGIQYGQLFNVKEDPDEIRNLYADKSMKKIREELFWHMIERCHFMADPLPVWLTQF